MVDLGVFTIEIHVVSLYILLSDCLYSKALKSDLDLTQNLTYI